MARARFAAYRTDLEQFAAYLRLATPADAARQLLGSTLPSANLMILTYRNDLQARGLSPATVNRRLASLRTLVALARVLGIVSWHLEVGNLRTRAYRDTRGPGDAGMRALLVAAEAQADRKKAVRDVALVHVLHDLALRRGEVGRLDLADVDQSSGRVRVWGKGQFEQVQVALPAATRTALSAWLEVRGDEPGPLFTTFDCTGKGSVTRRLTGGGLWSIIRAIGLAADLSAWPHGLRHAAITRALDVTDGNCVACKNSRGTATCDP